MTPTIGWSQIFRNWICSNFVRFNSIWVFTIRMIWKVKRDPKNWIKINSKFVQFRSTTPLGSTYTQSKTLLISVYLSDFCRLRFRNTFSKMLYSSIVCFPIFKNQLSKCQLVSFFLIFTLQRFSSKDLTCSLLMLLTLKVFLWTRIVIALWHLTSFVRRLYVWRSIS